MRNLASPSDFAGSHGTTSSTKSHAEAGFRATWGRGNLFGNGGGRSAG